MPLQLILPTEALKADIWAFRQAFIERNIDLHGSGELNKSESFEQWFAYQHAPAGTNLFGYPKSDNTTYFAWHTEQNRLVGCINLRHHLQDDFLRQYGGHIGYSIHPDCWGQGFGTEMLRLVLEKSDDLGIEDVLITCEVGNLASEKVIRNNGGEFECQIEANERGFNMAIKRFWIRRNLQITQTLL